MKTSPAMPVHGKSIKGILEQENPEGWDKIYAFHTFHEITMYYPMRVVQDRRYKLIWNVAWQLPYPFESDLWASSTWQSVHRNNIAHYGKRTVKVCLQRPEFELFDMVDDSDEVNNLSSKPEFKATLEKMKKELRAPLKTPNSRLAKFVKPEFTGRK